MIHPTAAHITRWTYRATEAYRAGDEASFIEACSQLKIRSETTQDVADDIRLAFTDMKAWYAKRGIIE